jgi:hypothetical protein
MSSKLVALAATGVILIGVGLASTPASAQWHHHGGGAGAAVAGGILGLAAGAMIGAAANQPPPPPMADPDYVAACARKYRSFDPASGTFMARDGYRYPCRLP